MTRHEGNVFIIQQYVDVQENNHMQTCMLLTCSEKKYHRRIYGFDCWIDVFTKHRYAENNAMTLNLKVYVD